MGGVLAGAGAHGSTPVRERLTPKQELWVACYLVHLNATRASIEAGYTKHPEASRVHGSRMLTKANVLEAVERRRQLVIEKLNVTADMVVSELAAVAFATLDDVARGMGRGRPDSERQLPKRAAKIKFRRTRTLGKDEDEDDVEVEHVEFVMHDKVAALKLLGQHLGIEGLVRGPKKVELHQHNERTFNLGAKFDEVDVEELLRAAEVVGPGEPET